MFVGRKIKVLIITTVASALVLSVGQFFPDWKDYVESMLKIIVPLAMVLIGGIALEDAGEKASGRNVNVKDSKYD
jgi:hypothetical protein